MRKDKRKIVLPRIEIPITGKVMGFQLEGEQRKAAIARILLEAEMKGNEGKSRIYLEKVRESEGAMR